MDTTLDHLFITLFSYFITPSSLSLHLGVLGNYCFGPLELPSSIFLIFSYDRFDSVTHSLIYLFSLPVHHLIMGFLYTRSYVFPLLFASGGFLIYSEDFDPPLFPLS